MKSLPIKIVLLFICNMAFAQDSINNGIKKSTSTITGAEEETFLIVEQMPQFPKGENALYKFLNKNIKYPKTALQNKKEGTVYISFIIEKDGSISNVGVLRGVVDAPEINEEALRVINLMPKWDPGTNNGRAVRVQYTIPLKFSLNDTAN